ncbi:MAG TPA: aldose 1-epimerase [Sphingomicrobium sp.]
MASQNELTLSAGDLRLRLSPSIGGSISAFEWLGENCARPILRKCNSPLENVLDAGCFPLVPYVNRIRGGRFTFRGREVRLTPNMKGDPSPLHGQGWLNAWDAERSDERGAVLTYRHRADEWPWDYEARQEFALDEQGLSVRLTCRNTSGEPMPCGLGQHPYFPCGPQTKIDTRVEVAWTIDEHVLPVDKVPAEGRYDLKDRRVCGQDLDNGFGGWGGEALLSDPEWPYAVRVSSPEAKFFQLYSPREGGIFVAEPVTHANAALNAPEAQWPELGMRVLEPGQAMSLDTRIEVTAG